MNDLTAILVFHFLKVFLYFLPSRVCMMIQTVTARNWTIQAAQNPASLQATGENWTLGTGLFSSKGTMITCRQVAEARGRNWLSVFFVSMENSSLVWSWQAPIRFWPEGTTVMGLVVLAPHSHLCKNLSDMLTTDQLRLPLIFQVHLNWKRVMLFSSCLMLTL